MAKSCDFKTTEASTKAWLRERKMIDKKLNIPEGMLGAFREQNTHWSKQAFKRFHGAGIQAGDRLFYEEQNGKIVTPNKEMFRRIDAHKGNFYKENMQYGSEVKQLAELPDEFVDDLYNLNLTPDVIKYLYNVSGTNFSMTDYGFIMSRLVSNLKSQGKTFSEILTDIKCL